MLHRKVFLQLSMAVACLVACTLSAMAADRFITVASTTSTENSGLFPICCRCFSGTGH